MSQPFSPDPAPEAPVGGAFLLPGSPRHPVLVPEDLTDEHRAIGRTIDEFWSREVEPVLDRLLRLEPGLARALLRRAAPLGLTAIHVPEQYGGLGLDLSSIMVAVEHLSEDPSYLGWHLGHSGIGTLPLVYYGTEAQKAKYLPRLAAVDLLAAYALTEPQAGSDALAVRTRADLDPDGRTYRLAGQKMWITNGGDADLFTVFANVGGEAFTAFLVERAFGVKSGAEEHKMGLSGTSTTALYFDNVKVPAGNVLGEVGRGHLIAFNVLNVGRLELGPNALRQAKKVLRVSLRYAAERRAFGTTISAFGAIRHKLATCAVRIFAVESATWRTVGLIDARAAASSAASQDDASRDAFDEFAAECAIIKVIASEMVDAVADHGVQIHGGYGYHRDYFVERAYRDARINRIFEGTNEINRLLVSGLLLKRAARGRLPLLAAARAAAAADAPAAAPATLVDRARALTLIAIDAAWSRYSESLREHQEVATCVADAIIETFVIESCELRADALTGQASGPMARTLATVYGRDALARIAHATEAVIAATCGEAIARRKTPSIRALAAVDPVDLIALRQHIAARQIDVGAYAL